MKIADAEVTQIPDNTVELTTADEGRKIIKLLDALEDHDDVQNVAANYTLTDEAAAELAGE